ncbi:hypothetical protein, partial [Ralstonia sp. Ralssp135]|uniref:hypothetical protein n=1 Tax=Ralstonia sp. Ralssp135 TaxID=3243016 RepID=UPI0039B08599
AISYDPSLFDPGVMLLARFLTAEPEGHPCHSAQETFSDLFHIYLSGTQATPQQRRAAIRRLAASDDSDLRRCVRIAL